MSLPLSSFLGRLPEDHSNEFVTSQPPVCYYCDADLDSALRRNPSEGAELLEGLKRKGGSQDLTEHEALSQGFICTSCVEKMSCEYCGQLGGEKRELQFEVRCSLCLPDHSQREYEPEDDIEMARRRAPLTMPVRQQASLFREVA